MRACSWNADVSSFSDVQWNSQTFPVVRGEFISSCLQNSHKHHKTDNLCAKTKIKKLQNGQKIWLMETTLSLACCCHFCKALIQIYLSHTLLFQRLFVSIMTKTMILGRCGARFLLPSGAPSKCEASHSTCCSARGWWVSSWRCWRSPWWCSRCSSSPEDCMCDDCLYYEWEEVTVETVVLGKQ